MFLSWAVKVMADDHSFYSAETAMLCACGANKVDWVGTPNDFDLGILFHDSIQQLLLLRWSEGYFTWERRCQARLEQYSSCLSLGGGWWGGGALSGVVIELIKLTWPGLLIELMSDLQGLHHNCMVRPRVGSEGSALFIIMQRGGYAGGRT